MGKIKYRRLFAAIGLLFFLLTACKERLGRPRVPVDPYYITGSRESRDHLRDLFMLLADENDSAENIFAVVREIANTCAVEKEYGKLIRFLRGRVDNYPDDPYNSYYLLMIAYAYIQKDSLPVAARYFDLIVKNYPDLIVNGESIHLVCLNQLIDLTENPRQLIWYYEELNSRFPEKSDLGVTLFMLAQAYEQIGDWIGAIQAYTRFLPYSGAVIPSFPDADFYARQQVDFYNASNKDWTYSSLSALLSAVKRALDENSPRELRRLQAKVNFFARTWEQGEADITDTADFSLSDFMRGDSIRYEDKLDDSSTATGAFLRTWGWSQYYSTWYLYFRRINFPLDPDIHGRWEWAGVYYGEKF